METRKLQSLSDVSHALANAPALEDGLHRMFELLDRHHGVSQGEVVVLDERGDPSLVVPHGAALEPRESRGRTLVERLRNDLTCMVLPISLDKKHAGQLAVVFVHKPEADLEAAQRFLRVIASMIAQALRAHRLAEGERGRLLEENRTLRRELVERYELQNIVGNSGPMRQVFDQIAQVANGTTTVLVRGESGTGKELIAHAIHYNSPRAQGPFVRVSCAALPETLVESELFGHEKGAFTGAHAQKKGRFELADGGTLFLDEVGELSIATQVKLLRVLQEREFERLGGTKTLRANVRLIAATNRDIEKAIASGAFREDLYYRLDVFTVFVPPLRDRKPDIMPLADHFLAKHAPKLGRKKIKRISTAAIDMLTAYHWPGNVRELENAIERAVVMCDGNVLHAHHLPPTLQTAEASGTVEARTLADATAAFERDLIADTLKSTRGNRAKAARILGTTERILGYKASKYAIDARRFRA
ncbi:MAG: sigma 54-interacting transcriptional regulator [Polyangiales bacterium]